MKFAVVSVAILLVALVAAWFLMRGRGLRPSGEEDAMHRGAVGSCCQDLREAMELPGPSFRIEENGILYLTVARPETEEGPAHFDMAVIFCPFCGKTLQHRGEIRKKAAR